jgi:thioesterase domain-containing protein/acyl carrier protein
MSAAVNDIIDAPPSRSAEEIRSYLIGELSKSLDVQPAVIDPTVPLDQLGVDSLMALGTAGGLAGWLGRDVPVTLMWDYRSIDAIAGALASVLPARTLPAGVVALQPDGEGIPIFGLPGLAGTPLAFAALASKLGDGQPFYGLAVPGYDAVPGSYDNVHDIAVAMLEMIQQVRPIGPYRLAGTCFGGMLAYEVARLLVAAGEQVTLLAIYDAFTPAGRIARPLWQRLFVHLSHLATGKSGLKEFLDKMHWSHLSARITRSQPEYWAEPAPADSDVARHLWNTNAIAAANFRPAHYSGPLVWFGAAERSKYADFYKMMPCGGWSVCTAGKVTSVIIPGNHGSLIGPDHAETATKALLPFLAAR